MTQKETASLLKLISELWRQFQPNPETITAWGLIMESEDPRAMFAAVKYLAKTKPDGYMPTPPDIFRAARELKRPLLDGAIEVWARKPEGAETEREQEAWRLWGGFHRYGALPDPKYCDDTAEAEKVLGFARKEFIDLFNAIGESQDKALSHAESKKFLESLGEKTPRLK